MVTALPVVITMFKGRTVSAQVLDIVPFKHFEYLARKFAANHWSKTLPAWSHFVCLAYAQITRREGLRDLVACLNWPPQPALPRRHTPPHFVLNTGRHQ